MSYWLIMRAGSPGFRYVQCGVKDAGLGENWCQKSVLVELKDAVFPDRLGPERDILYRKTA